MVSRNKVAVMLTTDSVVDRRILLQAEALRSIGWTVKVIAPRKDTSRTFQKTPLIVRLPDDIRRFGSGANYLQLVFQAIAFLKSSSIGLLKGLLWKYCVNQPRYFKKLFIPKILKEKADVFVAHDLSTLESAALAAQAHGAKLIYDSHELYCEQELSSRVKRLWEKIEAAYIKQCSFVITINQSIAEELQRRYDLTSVKVILNAEVSDATLTYEKYFHSRYGLAFNEKIVLYQGTIDESRNIRVLIDAFRLLCNSNVVLIFLGAGKHVPRLRRLVMEYGINSKIYFHDAVPQEQLLSLTKSADVGIIPYLPTCLNNYYCTPNKLFEYIATGVPIIASDLPELRRFVNGYQIGEVCEMVCPKTVAVTLDSFFSDPKAYEYFKSNVREVSKLLSWDVEKIKLLSIYRNI
ncbi:hypothetical protein CJP73_06425 [Neopusillimonas maritima]|uniref:Glycosyltransferase subfamily 4-like N-terminal domain-containing protein n=2 Tax=Neopusillimonas maritima TaxID=2026239 RepID=A0A3A1YTP1_9BURK|nr:hypothetical protein CJP73_06425 [Neopusillimonas maritima]